MSNADRTCVDRIVRFLAINAGGSGAAGVSLSYCAIIERCGSNSTRFWKKADFTNETRIYDGVQRSVSLLEASADTTVTSPGPVWEGDR